MIAAGHPFYDSTAFGSLVAVVLGLLTIAVTIWVTLRAANPKRRLYYKLLSDTPLITRRKDLAGQMKVIYGNRELNSPRVVNVQIVSKGRRDITRDAFDDRKPLCLDLGTTIVECIKVTGPLDREEPACAVDGSKLLIGPSHLGRFQWAEFSLLVDGDPPEIVPPQQSLIDVEILHGDPMPSYRSQRLLFATGIGGGLFAVIFTIWTITNWDTPVALLIAVLLGLVGLYFGYKTYTSAESDD